MDVTRTDQNRNRSLEEVENEYSGYRSCLPRNAPHVQRPCRLPLPCSKMLMPRRRPMEITEGNGAPTRYSPAGRTGAALPEALGS